MPLRSSVACALLLAWTGPASALGESDAQRVVAVLQRRSPETRTPARLAEELARLGPEWIPFWRGWLVGEGIEAVFLASGEYRPDAWAVAPEAAGELALAALSKLPADAVLADLERGILRDGPTPGDFLAAFRVLASLATADGLPLYWKMTALLGPDVAELPRFRAEAEQALAAILGRDARGWRQLSERLVRLEPHEVALFLGSAHAAGRAEAYPLVVELFDRELDSRLCTEALRTLARLEREQPWRFEPELLGRVQRAWPRLDADDRRVVIRLLGASEDRLALAPLREWLADSDPLLASNAAAALVELARLDFGRDEVAWERWEEREQAWWDAEYEPLLARLEAGPESAARACAELASHPLFRREIARALGSRLRTFDPKVQALAATCASTLGSRAALPGLAALAQQCSEPELRARLLAAVTALGGSLPRRADEPGG